MSNPERNLGSREKRLAELVPKLSEALKRACSNLDEYAIVSGLSGHKETAKKLRIDIHEFDLLTLEADRI